MIGYVLQQELGNELPFEKRIATLLTQIEVDRDDPAFGEPDEADRAALHDEEAAALAAEKGWAFKRDGDEHAPRRPVAGAASGSSGSSRSSGCSSTAAS